jgi:hypothetical protein
MLTENCSKAQELSWWEAFLATLPRESYLAMYLDGSSAVLADRMRNDMACDLLKELRDQKTQAELDTKEAKAERDKAQTELITLKTAVASARRELSRLEEDFMDVAKAASSLHNRACQDHLQVKLASDKAAKRQWGAA